MSTDSLKKNNSEPHHLVNEIILRHRRSIVQDSIVLPDPHSLDVNPLSRQDIFSAKVRAVRNNGAVRNMKYVFKRRIK